MDDIELLREYVEHGSEEAFAVLVKRHINKVYSVALRHTRNPLQAEEITQAVFVILARKSRHLGRNVILSGWLYQTARLTAITAIRSEIRRSHRERQAHMQTETNQSESDSWTLIAPLLDSAMAELNEKDRHAVVLRYFDDKSLKEIGATLGGSESAAKMRLSRAVEKLRSFFMKRGVVLSAAVLTATISANCVQAAPAALVSSASAVALAHGATVGGSTVALIEGALKLMAWAKIKVAMIVGAAVILSTGAGVVAVEKVHSIWAARYPDIGGAWEGVMHLDEAGVESGDGSSSRLVLKLAKTREGYRATSDWVEMGRAEVPMGKVVYDYPTLKIERNPREIWTLRVNGDATQMVLEHSAHFTEPDPVLLRRTAAPSPVPKALMESEFMPRKSSALQGYWKGSIGQEGLPVSVRIAEQSDGTFRAEGDIPGQGIRGRPLSVVYSRPTVQVAVATGTGMFKGEIDAANSKITGSWIQGGQAVPAAFERADYQAEHARDGEKDYTFSSASDLQGHWKGTWVVRFGSVKVPIRLVLDIAKLPGGAYSAELSNIDQFGNDSPMAPSDFKYSAPELRMAWKWTETAFKGTLKNGKITGVWEQGGGGFPLVFERSGAK